MKRAFAPDEPELMDLPQPVTPELKQDLLNLASLNRYFGSHALIRSFLELWLQPGRAYRILDLATGAGDIPRFIVQWARKRGISVQILALDASPSTLAVARSLGGDFPEIEWLCADALQYRPGVTFDMVSCSLALHHFSECDAARLLRRCRELSHGYVLVADLERSRLASWGIWFITATVYREHMTQYDGRLSARRAFSFMEFRSLAEAAGWENFRHSRFFCFRQALWMTNPMLCEASLPDVIVAPLPCAV